VSFDDRLRESLDRAVPNAPRPEGVRAGLGPAMAKARLRYRIRRGIGVAALSVGLAGGTAVAAVQLTSPDNEVDTFTTVPAPEQTSTTTAPPTTSAPVTTSTSSPAPTTSSPAPTTSSPAPTTSSPAPTTSVPAPTTTAPGPNPLPTTTVPPSGTTAPADPTVLGPHLTDCGSVTFAFTEAAVTVSAHTADAGYEFSVEGEGSTEVEAEWDEGPADDCRVAAHLEDGELEIQVDEDDEADS
jgi:hypothetical protein